MHIKSYWSNRICQQEERKKNNFLGIVSEKKEKKNNFLHVFLASRPGRACWGWKFATLDKQKIVLLH